MLAQQRAQLSVQQRDLLIQRVQVAFASLTVSTDAAVAAGALRTVVLDLVLLLVVVTKVVLRLLVVAVVVVPKVAVALSVGEKSTVC